MIIFLSVNAVKFQKALTIAWVNNSRIEKNVHLYTQTELAGFHMVLSDDGKSGFAITQTGELTCVFSSVKGRGEALVSEAIRRGAKHLNCFDGHLTSLYGKMGFIETNRVPNWDKAGPDVVYMKVS